MRQLGVLLIVFGIGLAGGLCYLTGSEPTWDRWALLLRPAMPAPWPPQVGEPFPEVGWLDLSGRTVRLSDLRGQPLLVEWIGLPCPACQAFSGGDHRGGFAGIRPQANLASIEQYYRDYAGGRSMAEDGVLYVQLLFYGLDAATPPTLDEARRWARHFGLDRSDHVRVLIAPREVLGHETRVRIPGFQLIDSLGIVRADAGKTPRGNLYTDLLPKVPVLLREEGARRGTAGRRPASAE